MMEENGLPNGWKYTYLSEFGKVITGKTPSKNNPEDWGELIDFITPTEIRNDKKYIFNTPRKLSKLGYERFAKMILPEKSIIVTCIGSDMGKVILNKNKALTNQQINSIIVNNDNYFNFVYYLLKNAHKFLRINAEGSGSTMPILNKRNFENLSFKIPHSKVEQKAIANILTSFDDKIELLQAQNETLETIAQTIFKEWFGKYQVGDDLPEGWRVGKVGDLVEIKRGGSPRPIKDYIADTGYKWHKISDATATASPYIFNIKESIRPEGLNKTTLKRKGDLVLSNSATPGLPKILEIDTCVHDGWMHFQISIVSNEFLYLLFQEIKPRLVQQGSGSVFVNLKTDTLRQFPVVIPDQKSFDNFDSNIKPVFNKIKYSDQQIQTLQATRDTLLPKLMSGQLRVAEFQEQLSEVM